MATKPAKPASPPPSPTAPSVPQSGGSFRVKKSGEVVPGDKATADRIAAAEAAEAARQNPVPAGEEIQS